MKRKDESALFLLFLNENSLTIEKNTKKTPTIVTIQNLYNKYTVHINT